MGIEVFYQQVSLYYKRSLINIFNHLAMSGRCFLPSIASSDLYIVAVDDSSIIESLSTDNKGFPDI